MEKRERERRGNEEREESLRTGVLSELISNCSATGNGPNRYQYPLRSPLEHVGSLPETFIPSPAVLACSDDVGTAKNEAELSYNDPNVTLPTLDSPSVPLGELSSQTPPSGRRESTLSPTASETQLTAIHAAPSAARDVFRSAIHAGAAALAGDTNRLLREQTMRPTAA